MASTGDGDDSRRARRMAAKESEAQVEPRPRKSAVAKARVRSRSPSPAPTPRVAAPRKHASPKRTPTPTTPFILAESRAPAINVGDDTYVLVRVRGDLGIELRGEFLSLQKIPPRDKPRNPAYFVRYGVGYRVRPDVRELLRDESKRQHTLSPSAIPRERKTSPPPHRPPPPPPPPQARAPATADINVRVSPAVALAVPVASHQTVQQYTHIEGPVSLSEHVGLGKLIYLFGDRHVMQSTCAAGTAEAKRAPSPKPFSAAVAPSPSPPPSSSSSVRLPEFLEHTFIANPGRVIDVFSESNFVPAAEEEEEEEEELDPIQYKPNYLTDLNVHFAKCLLPDKSACEWSRRVRFHYADVRDRLFGYAYGGAMRPRAIAINAAFRLGRQLDFLGETDRQNTGTESRGTPGGRARQAWWHASPNEWRHSYLQTYRPLVRDIYREMVPLVDAARYASACAAWLTSGKRGEAPRRHVADTPEYAPPSAREIQAAITRLLTANTDMTRRVENQVASVSDPGVRATMRTMFPLPTYDPADIARGFAWIVADGDVGTAASDQKKGVANDDGDAAAAAAAANKGSSDGAAMPFEEWESFRYAIVRFRLAYGAYMDRYLLGRLFRDQWERPTRGIAAPIANVVIYVGNNHATRYRRLFAAIGIVEVGGVERSDTPGRNFQCLSLRQFAQPFFGGDAGERVTAAT